MVGWQRPGGAIAQTPTIVVPRKAPKDRASRVQTTNHRLEKPHHGPSATVGLRTECPNVHGVVAHAAAQKLGRLSQLRAAQLTKRKVSHSHPLRFAS